MVVTLTNNSFTCLLSPKIKCRASSNIIMVSCLKSNGNSEAKKLKRSFEKKELWDSIDGWVKQNILPMAKPIEKCWQPQDLLPNPCSESFFEEVEALRKRSKQLSDEYFVVLVGNMITEEALPTYQSRWTIADKVQDITGIDDSSWAIWARAWSAEENRHGDLLNKYLYLSGRVDMNRVENTIQHLIAFGMDNKSGTDSYKGMFYASFQERATFISHANTAKLAKKQGDEKLAQICGVIASDEKRHESAYTKTLEKLFEVDPDGCIIVFADMMRKKITMPAHLMFDGKDVNLFSHFSNVASRLGVYTALDYIDILEHFVVKWKVDKLRGLSSEGQRAQHYVCELGQRLRKVEERAQKVFSETEPVSFSWIFDKRV